MKYKVQFKEEQPIVIEIGDGKMNINEQAQLLDILKIHEQHYHILKDNKSFDVIVKSLDRQSKKIALSVNGKIFDLKLSNELDELLLKMGMGAAKSDKMDVVKAPMPGLVLKILIEIGQEVKKGDSLLILEAMKMENIIKATGNGIVKAIKVNIKDAVEKNQLLIEME